MQVRRLDGKIRHLTRVKPTLTERLAKVFEPIIRVAIDLSADEPPSYAQLPHRLAYSDSLEVRPAAADAREEFVHHIYNRVSVGEIGSANHRQYSMREATVHHHRLQAW